MKIAPSMLACDYTCFGEEIKKISKSDYIHLDIMDGNFVPNISFGPGVVKTLKPLTEVPFDVHLMLKHPIDYLEVFKDAGADIICFHIECEDDIKEVIKKIKKLGLKPAIAVKPGTDISRVFEYASELYMVLVMTVEPGFGGQTIMLEQLEKAKILKDKFPNLLIQADGGITRDNIGVCKNMGVDICVVGTAVFCAEDVNKEIEYLKKA